MTGLRKPPERQSTSQLALRMIVLLALLAAVGVTIWAAVTNQRIDLVESISIDTVDRPVVVQVGDLSISLEEGATAPRTVVLLHDFDVSGGLLLDPVASRLGDEYQAVIIDLPGFGLSERVPVVGDAHTVAAMADVVAAVLSARYDPPAIVAGVGLGGEVAAELAVTSPELVSGLVMVDVDFDGGGEWVAYAETLPYLGRPVIHTFEAGGRFGVDRWAPNCKDGGWCPSAAQIEERHLAASIVDTTDSLQAFLETPPSSLVPSDLGSISAPAAYVWSTAGNVSPESVDIVRKRLPELVLVESDTWKAHLTAPESVVGAIEQIAG